ncbi:MULTISPECIES: hypothetical protein [unclassified Rhizobium]|nr:MULTISPECIES: hypothetical protein [unclassified Rhizobium]
MITKKPNTDERAVPREVPNDDTPPPPALFNPWDKTFRSDLKDNDREFEF